MQWNQNVTENGNSMTLLRIGVPGTESTQSGPTGRLMVTLKDPHITIKANRNCGTVQDLRIAGILTSEFLVLHESTLVHGPRTVRGTLQCVETSTTDLRPVTVWLQRVRST